ncbi:hypothetical protein [Changpingibacter yushuensis]|uniref:hypothetical protein n=1 Tax=Changpingibacter yushuensis TaxID=2758440 RepID=UPI0021CD23B9|nr:hypothetical protein [Changpingibacter yushuensis]
MFVLDAAVDVGQACSDAVLVALERGEVDGVCEVRGEELVGLVFEASAVRCQLGEFVGSGRESFVECLHDFLGEADVLGFVDRDAGVAVGDQLLGDGNGDCAPGAFRLAGSAAAAGEVGVLDALLVRRQVELQAGAACPAEQ